MDYRHIIIAAIFTCGPSLSGCLLVDEFAEASSTLTDSQQLLREQLPGTWIGLATSEKATNAGWVAAVEFRQGGLSLDLGLAQYQGTWEISDDDTVSMSFGSNAERDSLTVQPTIINEVVVDLSVALDLGGGDPQPIRLRRADRSTVSPGDLWGDWRTSLLGDGTNRLGTEFGETSHYGVYRVGDEDRYISGKLRTFPCESNRDCWMLADAVFADGVQGDNGADLGGRAAPLLGGAVIVEQSSPSAIYLPVLSNNGIDGQLLAEPSAL